MKAPILFIRALSLSALTAIILSAPIVLAQNTDGNQPPPTTPATSDPRANPSIDPSLLTPENGWVCDANKSSCHNTATDGYLKGATANCTGRGASQVCISHQPELQKFAEDHCLTGTFVEGLGCSAVSTITAPYHAIANLAWGVISDTALAILTGVAFIILMFANLLLGISGTLFNWVVVKTVFEFSSLIGNSAGLLTAWRILRDLGNMLLLFGFIFIGIAMILDLHSYPARKTLPKLIIFAVLMNFSLFAAEAVIDVSNGLSSVFYSQANVNPCNGIVIGNTTSVAGTASDSNLSTSQANLEDCSVNYGIAGHIMQSTGLSSIFSVNSFPGESQTVVVYLGLALFATIGAVVLFSASIMLIVRAVTLTMLMVVAPLGFAGMAIPPLQEQAMKWWKTLLAQSFFVPVLLLLIFVSLKIVDGFSSLDSQSHSLAGALTEPNVSNVGIILIFTLVIGFLVASLLAAKKFGAAGANAAISLGTKFAFGGIARGTNLAIGGTAFGLQRAQQRTGFGGPAGRFAVNRGLRPLANANLDLRKLPGMAGALRAAGAGDGANASDHTSFMDLRHQYQDARDGKRGRELDAEYEKEVAKIRLEDESHAGALSAQSEQFLATLSTKELEELHGIKEGVTALARSLTPDQFSNLMKSDKLTEAEKSRLRDERLGGLADDVAAGNGAQVRRWSTKDLEEIASSGAHGGLLDNTEFASLMSDDQYDALKKKLTPQQLARLDGARDARFNPVNAGATISNMNSDQISNLRGSILAQGHVFTNFTVEDFEKIRRKGKLTQTERQSMGQHIQNIATSPGDPRSAEYLAYLNSDPRVASYWN